MSIFDADLILRVYQRDRAAEFYLYDGCYQYYRGKADYRSDCTIYMLPLPCQLELRFYFDFALQI